ncbi:hypothetical protein FHL15_009425 [Xylaria flabelliformis]|uniref:CENP-V/GFA domain-containing protein n=1 Tax=Xylaria flabelliformis TaxID=2512241 RepID=A0A553HNZ0_9PEZI|nr:hypothetical protein FHL15_009425 [Xylaria flabelliformis]
MEAQCQCGAVQFKTPLPKPLALYICHCAECRRQSSSAFGTSAIFPRFELPKTDLLSCYTSHFILVCRVIAQPPLPSVEEARSVDKEIECVADRYLPRSYFCHRCGTRLIHTTPGKNVVSVKGGCIEGLDWDTAIHIWTKSAMVPIPEGSEAHSEEPTESDYSSVQESLDQPTDNPGPLMNSGGWPGEAQVPEMQKLGHIKGACELSGL